MKSFIIKTLNYYLCIKKIKCILKWINIKLSIDIDKMES